MSTHILKLMSPNMSCDQYFKCQFQVEVPGRRLAMVLISSLLPWSPVRAEWRVLVRVGEREAIRPRAVGRGGSVSVCV